MCGTRFVMPSGRRGYLPWQVLRFLRARPDARVPSPRQPSPSRAPKSDGLLICHRPRAAGPTWKDDIWLAMNRRMDKSMNGINFVSLNNYLRTSGKTPLWH